MYQIQSRISTSLVSTSLASLFAFLAMLITSTCAQASPVISLQDWIFNIDGTTHEAWFGDPLPTTGTLLDGYGTLSLEVSGAGTHNVIGYFDYEMYESINTFFNESGQASGIPAIGQSWEIDEPGFLFGDIVDNVFLGALDNSNGVPAGFEDDVAFALGWDFSLLDGESAVIDFTITDLLPTADFFLTHTDPDVDESFYFYSTLDIQASGTPAGPNVPVSEPPVFYLVLAPLLILLLRRRLCQGQ